MVPGDGRGDDLDRRRRAAQRCALCLRHVRRPFFLFFQPGKNRRWASEKVPVSSFFLTLAGGRDRTRLSRLASWAASAFDSPARRTKRHPHFLFFFPKKQTMTTTQTNRAPFFF
ncbi:hypothetical protein TW95_gp0263 [Pandoravirus inopinatum]|uniref:Uncharacterized protein n=1 Tax=Pandoravirus inopinatum TaxID=1605721 RepID=A0A0B5JBQ3_9VIRU|nr:hypothetical protein TW95_gp0263 [Pandoravirus inopinatum]AJF96997.1 hypothetical protein [Pandoravirus inopinatum]